MSDENLDEIKRLIDSMQSGLVELFDQLKELRRRLDITGVPMPSDTQSSVVPLFTEVEKLSIVSPDDTAPELVPPSQDMGTLPDEKEPEPILPSSAPSSEPESEAPAIPWFIIIIGIIAAAIVGIFLLFKSGFLYIEKERK